MSNKTIIFDIGGSCALGRLKDVIDLKNGYVNIEYYPSKSEDDSFMDALKVQTLRNVPKTGLKYVNPTTAGTVKGSHRSYLILLAGENGNTDIIDEITDGLMKEHKQLQSELRRLATSKKISEQRARQSAKSAKEIVKQAEELAPKRRSYNPYSEDRWGYAGEGDE